MALVEIQQFHLAPVGPTIQTSLLTEQEKIIKLNLSWIILFVWIHDPSACQHRVSLVAVEVARVVAAAAVATAKPPLWGHLSRHWLS